MANPQQGKPLSLYANLLVNAPGTIVGAPVYYNQNDALNEKKNVNPGIYSSDLPPKC